MTTTHETTPDRPAMTFRPDEMQSDLRDLVAQILTHESTDERVAALDAQAGAWDEALYQALIEAGILAAIVGDDDEPGMGMAALMLVLIEAGRTLARVPLAPSAVAALTFRAAGRGDRADEVAGGVRTVALALPERRHSVRVVDDHLRGSVGLVHHGGTVSHLLVAADDGSVWSLPADAPGLTARRTGFSYVDDTRLTLDVPLTACERLDAVDRRFVEDRWRTALASVTVGACAEAVARTAAYTSERRQFGEPLSHKQGVLLQAADGYIDTECIRLTAMRAATALDRDDPRASATALEAAWWAGDGGCRVVHVVQHLHGGIGADTDNHIHRFFVLVRQLDIMLGGSDALLAELGGHLTQP